MTATRLRGWAIRFLQGPQGGIAPDARGDPPASQPPHQAWWQPAHESFWGLQQPTAIGPLTVRPDERAAGAPDSTGHGHAHRAGLPQAAQPTTVAGLSYTRMRRCQRVHQDHFLIAVWGLLVAGCGGGHGAGAVGATRVGSGKFGLWAAQWFLKILVRKLRGCRGSNAGCRREKSGGDATVPG